MDTCTMDYKAEYKKMKEQAKKLEEENSRLEQKMAELAGAAKQGYLQGFCDGVKTVFGGRTC